MSAQEKSEVLTQVEQTRWGIRRLLAQLQVPRSTYHRWRAPLTGRESKYALLGPCNRLSLPEATVVLSAALEFLE